MHVLMQTNHCAAHYAAPSHCADALCAHAIGGGGWQARCRAMEVRQETHVVCRHVRGDMFSISLGRGLYSHFCRENSIKIAKKFPVWNMKLLQSRHVLNKSSCS